jgi:hypothetical protein
VGRLFVLVRVRSHEPSPTDFRSVGNVFVEGCQSQVCYCNILDGDPSEIDQRDIFWLPLICAWIGYDLAQFNQVFEADETWRNAADASP